MAVLADIQDAVVTALNGAAWSLSFKAVRSYRPRYKREEMKTLHVTVAPGGFASQRLDRSRMQEDFVIWVAIQQAIPPADLAAIDVLVGLGEQIRDVFIRAGRLAPYPDAFCIGVDFSPASDRGFVPDDVDELGQFSAVLVLTFRVAR